MLHVLKLLFLVFIFTDSFGSDDSKLFVFVSKSMGQNLLKNYCLEADMHNAILVFNGLIDGSFKKTGIFISKIVSDKKIAVIIDDELFRKYGIDSVPSFVLVNGNVFDKITGNIGIKNAIEIFKENGEVEW